MSKEFAIFYVCTHTHLLSTVSALCLTPLKVKVEDKNITHPSCVSKIRTKYGYLTEFELAILL